MSTNLREPRILVTGVGAAPGLDLARSLIRHGCQVIGADAEPLAPGLSLPLTPRVIPSAADPRYGAELLALCRELQPDAIMPTVEHELAQLTVMRTSLEKLGVKTWLPDTHTINACTDKSAFYATLVVAHIPTPRTYLPHQLDDIPDGCPLVVKPRRGQGARDVYRCFTRQQAEVLCELVPSPIVQEQVTGTEFTADCLVDSTGQASVILRYRLVVKGGLSMVSATFDDEEVTARVKETLTAVGMVGLCCVQGFIRNDGSDERVVITEVNARIAGAFLVSETAGADLVGQALNGLLGRPIDHAKLGYKPGIRVAKYVETLTVTDVRTGR